MKYFLVLPFIFCITLQAQTRTIDDASILKIKLGDSFEKVKTLPVASWVGEIGIKQLEVQTVLSAFVPTRSLPFHAILTPPVGFKYLGVPLKNLSIYFVPQEGSFKVFAVTLNLELSEQNNQALNMLLTKQFGEAQDGHWASGGKVLLSLPPELGLVDITLQRMAVELITR